MSANEIRLHKAVKTALRITHNKLDDEISDYIKAAQHEMIRMGIEKKNAEDGTIPLIRDAIKTFCKMRFENDTQLIEQHNTSWLCQLDALRKSSNIKGLR